VTTTRAVARAACWLGGLVAALAALVAAGDRLPAPPLTDPGAAWAWVGGTDPVLATFALVRLAAIAVVAYLLAATALTAISARLPAPSIRRASIRLVLPSIRRVVHHAIGAGVAITVVGSGSALALGSAPGPASASSWSTAAPAQPRSADGAALDPTTEHERAEHERSPRDGPVLHALPDGPVLVDLGATPPDDPAPIVDAAEPAPPAEPPPAADLVPAADPVPGAAGPPVLRSEPGAARPDATAPTDPRSPAPVVPPTTGTDTIGPAGSSPPPPSAPTSTSTSTGELDLPARTHTITPGDHLWGVAEAVLEASWGDDPSPAATAAYLEALIDRNRSVLAVPDDPDLVFPGQVFALPDVPAPPTA
jgi:hypothetical protein